MSLESSDFYDIAEELLEYFAFLNTLENDYALSCEDGFTGGIFPVRQKIKDILAAAAVGASNEADGLNLSEDVAELRSEILDIAQKAKQVVGGYIDFTPSVKIRNFNAIKRALSEIAQMLGEKVLLEESEDDKDMRACRIDENLFRKEIFEGKFLDITREQVWFNGGGKFEDIFVILLLEKLNIFILSVLEDNFYGYVRLGDEEQISNSGKMIADFVSKNGEYLQNLIQDAVDKYDYIIQNVIKPRDDEMNRYLIEKIDDVVDTLSR